MHLTFVVFVAILALPTSAQAENVMYNSEYQSSMSANEQMSGANQVLTQMQGMESEAENLKETVMQLLPELNKIRKKLEEAAAKNGTNQKFPTVTYNPQHETIADGFPSDCSAWKDGPNYGFVAPKAGMSSPQRGKRQSMDEKMNEMREQADRMREEMSKDFGGDRREEIKNAVVGSTILIAHFVSPNVLSVACSDKASCKGKFDGVEKTIQGVCLFGNSTAAATAGDPSDSDDTTEEPEDSGSRGIMEIANILLVLIPAWIF